MNLIFSILIFGESFQEEKTPLSDKTSHYDALQCCY